MSMPKKSSVLVFIAGILAGAFLLWFEAGPAAAFTKPQEARFKVEVKGVQQMYSQHTHDAEGQCDFSDYSSGSEKIVFKTKPIVITAFHAPGEFNPSLFSKAAPNGLPATATVTRNFTPRITPSSDPECNENGGGGEQGAGPDCGTKKVSLWHLDLGYDEETKNQLFLYGGNDEDVFHNCPGAGDLAFPWVLSEASGGKPIRAQVSQDELFDPSIGKWIALASGTRRYDETDFWAKTTVHWDVSFTRLGK
jgi:hypothetical protein